jgi:hypothetical protein
VDTAKAQVSDNVQVVIPAKKVSQKAVAPSVGKKPTLQKLAPNTIALPTTSITPQWTAAPAHPSHLLDRLDPNTVAWLQQSSPVDYKAYITWELAHEAKRPEAEGMHRALIDKLDYMMWLGVQIPAYWPRRRSQIGPDGRPRMGTGRGSEGRVTPVLSQQVRQVLTENPQQTQPGRAPTQASPLSMGQRQSQYMQPRVNTLLQAQPQMAQHIQPQMQSQAQVQMQRDVQPQISQQIQQPIHQTIYQMPDLHAVLGFEADSYPDLTSSQESQFAAFAAGQPEHVAPQELQRHQQMQQQHHHDLQQAQHHLSTYDTASAAYHQLHQPHYGQIQDQYTQHQPQLQHYQQGQFGGYDPMSGLDLNLNLFGGPGDSGMDPGLEEAFFNLPAAEGRNGL